MKYKIRLYTLGEESSVVKVGEFHTIKSATFECRRLLNTYPRLWKCEVCEAHKSGLVKIKTIIAQ